ncbi:MAG: carboxypeptidase regulatory-like domain-containing protein, partial [Planctomycetota bacterium]
MLSIVNPSFDTGDLSGWDVYTPPGGSASAVTSYSNTYSSGTYTPVDGTHFALLKTDGPGSYTTVSQTFSAQIGDTISGWAFFDAEDYLPYNDTAVVAVKSGGTTVATLFFENIQSVGSYGQTPWTYWEYEFTAAGGYSLEAKMANTGDNVWDSYMGLDAVVYVLGNPRVVGQSPSDASIGPLGSVLLDFSEPIDQDSFSHEDDIVSFNGPEGPVAVTDHQWVDEDTLGLTFDLQYVVGTYDMVVGPGILDLEGNPMDEAQTITFAVGAPQVSDHTPSGSVIGPVDALQLSFDHPMDQTSFLPDDDIISFTGPEGTLAVNGFRWLGDQTLEVLFDAQSSLGSYELVFGPEVLSLWNNPLDQDGDLIVAEAPEDWYTADFTIAAPRVLEHAPSGYVTAPVQRVQFMFDQDMEPASFLPEDDVVSFVGPNGSIAVTDHRWIDAQTLELSFDQQNAAGTYEIVIGPQILNPAGIAMDQDGDFNVGEDPDDLYTATFTRMFTSTITEDTVWGPIDPPILFDSTVTVAAGATLTIEAGSTLKFGSSAGLIVNGSLDVRGTPEAPVILTSSRDDIGGDTNGDGSASSPAAGDWQGTRFNSSSAAGTLENVEIRYADKAIYGTAQGAFAGLRNAVLRDGNFGVYVYTPYVEIDAENCLIVDNNLTGVFVRADSKEVFRNSTIVGNGFGGTGWHGAGVHLGGANLTLDSTIVAHNRTGLHHQGDPPLVTVRNSDFYNPDGQEIVWDGDPGIPQLDEEGNITENPLFVDRNAGNYELFDGSPAIDSGRGLQAPQTDILGRPRYDDHGMPNEGNGYPAFVDMGAFERQEETPSPDLAVVHVGPPDPETLGAGDTFTVEWTVTNMGPVDRTYPWQDRLYLSDDPYLGNDELVTTIDHMGPLASGAAYTETYSATVPATSGPKYVLVHTEADPIQREPVDTNNLGAAPRVLAVDVSLLELATPLTATGTQGQWDYYRFEATPGRTVLFSLDGEAGSAELYLRRTLPPTLSSYDATGSLPNQPDQELRLLDPVAGTYYVGVLPKSLGGGSGSYTLCADLATLDIREVTPNEVGNAGTATIKILGDAFDPAAEVQLVAEDATIIEGEEYYQDSATLFATFDLAAAGAAPGLYDVVVTNPGPESATAADAVTILDGGVPGFSASLSMPGVTRPGRVIDVRVDYTNTSTVDMFSPVLTLDSGVADTEWSLPWRDGWIVGPDFRVMGLSSEGPPTVLHPGQTESITVQLRVPFRPERVTVTLSSVGAVPTDGSNEPIDWDKFEAEVRPPGVEPEVWEPAFVRLQTQIGTTWGDYAETLRESAGRWYSAGSRVYCVRELLRMELDEAYELPTGMLAGRVTRADSGEHLTGVTVYFVDQNGAVQAESATDTDGAFSLFGIADGTYTVSLDDYVVEQNGQIDFVADLFGLDVKVVSGGRIAGMVTGPVGQPLADAWIHIVDADGITIATFTDVTGAYTLGNLHPGIWTVSASAEGFAPPEAIPVEIQSGSAHVIDINMDAGATLSGSVTDSAGTPIAGAQVLASATVGPSVSAMTGDAGDYSIAGLSPGDWHITVSADGYALASLDLDGLANNDVVTGVNFALIEGVEFEGIVVEGNGTTPVTYASVVFAAADQYVGMSHTGEDGVFRQSQLPPGEYSAIVSAPSYDDIEVPFSLSPDGLETPLFIQMTDHSEILRVGASVEEQNDDAPSEAELRRMEDFLRYVVAPGLASPVFSSPNAARLLRHHLGPRGHDGNRVAAPRYFGPSHALSLEAKDITGCIYSFSDAKEDTRDDIRQKVESSLCNDGVVANVFGQVNKLVFYEPGSRRGDWPNRWDPGWSFGRTHEGGWRVVHSSVTSRGTSDSGSGPIEEFEVDVQVLYTFPDVYEFTEYHEGIGGPDRMAYELGRAGWTTTFRTSLQIQDTLSFTVYCAQDPDPEDEDQDEDDTDPRTSYTPEDKFGPGGYDTPGTPEGSEVRFIPAGQTLDYRVEFWNKEDAPVPTQDAIIMDQLDPNVLDLSTLEFTRIGFLDWDVKLPGGQVIDARIDCRPQMDLAVEVRAGLGMQVPGFANNADITENTLVWWFHAIDPETGEWPEDPMAGFLPPYNPETGYEIGWVEFTVDPVQGLASGTELANLAYVEFDFAGDIYDHPAPKVDPDVEPAEPAPWINTIDAGVPVSNVLPLPETSSQAAFLVQWTGEDEENGSGLAGYDIYVSTDGGDYERWLEDITGTSAVFPGDFGHTYTFYSIAADNVGHREPAPATPDAQITTPPNDSPVANDDYVIARLNTALIIDVLANDTDDGVLDPTRVRVSYPAGHGTLVVNDDGTITYTPEVDYLGPDSFQYKVKDDHRAESNATTVTITVKPPNDPPAITSFSITPAVIDEGQSVSVTGEFADADTLDVHTVVFDWGDGSSDEVVLAVGQRSFSRIHAYPDDGPSAGPSYDYSVNVTVTDQQEEGDFAGGTVTVNNVAPSVTVAPSSLSVQYSDYIADGDVITISATDVPGDPLSAVAEYSDDGGGSFGPLPGWLSFSGSGTG